MQYDDVEEEITFDISIPLTNNLGILDINDITLSIYLSNGTHSISLDTYIPKIKKQTTIIATANFTFDLLNFDPSNSDLTLEMLQILQDADSFKAFMQNITKAELIVDFSLLLTPIRTEIIVEDLGGYQA